MPDEQNPFTDEDRTLAIIQQVVNLILQEVVTLDDITNDIKRNAMFQNVLAILDQLNIALLEVFPAEIANAYTAGHSLGSQLLGEAGIEEAALVGNLTDAVHVEALQEIATNGYSDLEAAIRTAGTMFVAGITADFTNIQDAIGQGILTGQSTKQITQAVQLQFAQRGLTSFITRDGKRLPLDFYAMTVTRTKVREAHTNGAANRYKENGVDLIRFPIRSHTCKVCGARERLVVSLNGETEGYPTVEDIGGLPPFHPNCRHYPIPVTDPSAYPPVQFRDRDMRTAESKEVYKNEQAIRVKANNEKKAYLKMKAEADSRGESFPNIGTWRRMKRRNDDEWKALQSNYQNSIRNIPI